MPRLDVIHSPYRQFFDPFLDYVEKTKRESKDELIGVIIPQLVEARWWEYLLHNHIATGLKTMLLLKCDERVVIINTPWYLRERKR